MVGFVWCGVVFFAVVLASAEVVLAKAALRRIAVDGEGEIQKIETLPFREKAVFQLLFGLSFFFCVLMDVLLAYSLCRGG